MLLLISWLSTAFLTCPSVLVPLLTNWAFVGSGSITINGNAIKMVALAQLASSLPLMYLFLGDVASDSLCLHFKIFGLYGK